MFSKGEVRETKLIKSRDGWLFLYGGCKWDESTSSSYYFKTKNEAEKALKEKTSELLEKVKDWLKENV
jgi:hypothetical protein